MNRNGAHTVAAALLVIAALTGTACSDDGDSELDEQAAEYHAERDQLAEIMAETLHRNDAARESLIAEAQANGENTAGAEDNLTDFMKLGSVGNELDRIGSDLEQTGDYLPARP